KRQTGNKSGKKASFVTCLKKIQASREDKLVTKMAKRRFCYLLKENQSIKKRQTGNKNGKKKILLPAQRKPKHQKKTNW
ncbi:MAG: hypothetical protein IJ054_03015, partial [Lachnospiraceae bacterium]|nr:hypothetical protein [Lachnospiraceae bacterium]